MQIGYSLASRKSHSIRCELIFIRNQIPHPAFFHSSVFWIDVRNCIHLCDLIGCVSAEIYTSGYSWGISISQVQLAVVTYFPMALGWIVLFRWLPDILAALNLRNFVLLSDECIAAVNNRLFTIFCEKPCFECYCFDTYSESLISRILYNNEIQFYIHPINWCHNQNQFFSLILMSLF